MALKESNKNRKKVTLAPEPARNEECESFSYNSATHIPRAQPDALTLKQLKYIAIGVGLAILALLVI